MFNLSREGKNEGGSSCDRYCNLHHSRNLILLYPIFPIFQRAVLTYKTLLSIMSTYLNIEFFRNRLHQSQDRASIQETQQPLGSIEPLALLSSEY